MSWLIGASILVLVTASYLAALVLALHRARRAAVQQRLDEIGRSEAGEWLTRDREGLLALITLLRTIARVAFYVLVLIEFAGWGTNAVLDTQTVLISTIIAVFALWLCTSVVAHAVAEHAGVGLVVGSLPFLWILRFAGRPVWRGLAFIDEAVRRLSGANLQQSESDEELLRSIEESHLQGELDPASAEMLENVVEFRTTEVSEIMTPRTDIEGVERTNDLGAVRAFIVKAGHSRIPVYEGNLDTILGILYVKDLIQYLGEDAADFDLEQMLRKPIVVPESKPVRELLGDFQKSEVHMAIVIDEYGGTSGLVTIEDVLEEIVGEIHDEHEPEGEEEPALVPIDQARAEVDGRFHIDDLNEALGLSLPEDDDYDTVGGFVLAQLGRVPAVGDSFESHNARFTALAATETHVERIAVELLVAAEPNGRGAAHAEATAK